jgi:hypothetical protein
VDIKVSLELNFGIAELKRAQAEACATSKKERRQDAGATENVPSVPDFRPRFSLAVAVWSFCRLYYFAFYVIEHHVDPDYRFSGLLSFVRYLISKERRKKRLTN